MIKTLTASAFATLLATASFAGSLVSPADEVEPQDDGGVFVPATGSGIGAPAIIGGVLAAAALAALIDNSSDGTTDGDDDEED
ncbi:hypothetical protein [Sulfitobacter sp. S190]|uniref:hypothetical protein n=1 Tax=Sulfitobacter sp. S190 TaxID=2867022 RepID=UPI0021A7CC8F|nr:hypothetical protein [Sulfitobacter sp. S190]UWR22570.1 hypothetical protein K3756_00795 [Sulfitobacter sp. S190]